jgi:hypothetical protein
VRSPGSDSGQRRSSHDEPVESGLAGEPQLA